jgi:hypothetical protein
MARPKGSKTNPLRRQLPFKQSEIERAIRGARSQGFNVSRIEIEPRTGKIAIVAAEPDKDADVKNPWDEVLKNAEDKKRPA